MMNENVKKYVKAMIVCIPIGAIVGLLCFIFTKVLNFVNNFRNEHVMYTIPFLFLAGLIIVSIFNKFDDKTISVKPGMKLVFENGHGKCDRIPLVLIPLVSFSTWLTNLCGGSCGREGVAVQIGATVSKYFSRLISHKKSNEIFLIAGIGSGFSAMFQTPIAGILFAMEVLTIGEFKFFALFPTVVESIVAYAVARFLGLRIEKYDVKNAEMFSNFVKNIDLVLISKIIFMAILFGICGLAFSTSLEKLKEIYNEKVKNKYIGIMLNGLILSILFLLFHYGRYSGTGANLIETCFENGKIYSYDFFLKAVLTIYTLSVGFQGGEVTPIFTIGATLGFILSKQIGVDFSIAAALGYISVFASATNTILCPIALGVELFGISNLPLYIISVAISYFINFNRSIYNQNKRNVV